MSKRLDQVIFDVLWVIDLFPKSGSWFPYLKLKDGKKLFFSIFIEKYGIKWWPTKYSEEDVIRRVRLVEFFDCFVKKCETKSSTNSKIIIESAFYRMVIVKVGKPSKERLELLSFYPYK